MKIEISTQRAKKFGLNLNSKLVAFLPYYAPMASKFAIIMNLRDKLPGLAKLSEIFLGFTSKRPLPKWRRDYFKNDELPNNLNRIKKAIPVILFVDTFNRYYEPENVRSAIKVLKKAGYYPFIPTLSNSSKILCCGRTYLTNGLIDNAKKEMLDIINIFKPYLKQGISVVGLEPSCILSFRDEIPNLIKTEDTEYLKNNSYTFEELLIKKSKKLKFRSINKKVLLHGHCHQKAFDAVKPIENLLNKIEGLEVENIQTSCCGMAGSFGYGKDTYEISMKMANERLFPTIKNNSNEVILIADGTSCRCQIKDGLNRKAIHLAKFLDENIIY